MKEIFQLQVVFGLTTALLEVPSGYLADMFGRKNAICVGTFICGLSFSFLTTAQGYWDLFFYEILVGISVSLISGADLSILYDSLVECRKTRKKAISNYMFSFSVSESLASVIGGFLVLKSFDLLLTVQAVVGWFPFLVALTLKEPVIERMSKGSHIENTKSVFKYIFKGDKSLLIIFSNNIIWGLATFIAVWTIQKHWQLSEVPLAWFGVIWAAYNITVGIVGKITPYLETKFGSEKLLYAIGILPIVGFLSLGWLQNYYGVLLGICFSVSRGLNSVLLKDAFNWRIPAKMRATANSIQSLVFRLGFAIVGPFVGIGLDQYGFKSTFTLLAAIYFGVFLYSMVPFIKAVKAKRINNDRYIEPSPVYEPQKQKSALL